MAWEYLRDGKDQVYESGVYVDVGSFHTCDEVLIALIKALIKGGVVTKKQLLDEL